MAGACLIYLELSVIGGNSSHSNQLVIPKCSQQFRKAMFKTHAALLLVNLIALFGERKDKNNHVQGCVFGSWIWIRHCFVYAIRYTSFRSGTLPAAKNILLVVVSVVFRPAEEVPIYLQRKISNVQYSLHREHFKFVCVPQSFFPSLMLPLSIYLSFSLFCLL